MLILPIVFLFGASIYCISAALNIYQLSKKSDGNLKKVIIISILALLSFIGAWVLIYLDYVKY